MTAQVRIILEEGGPDSGNTWITVVPIDRSYPHRVSGVLRAAALACASFSEGIMRNAETVTERLIEGERT